MGTTLVRLRPRNLPQRIRARNPGAHGIANGEGVETIDHRPGNGGTWRPREPAGARTVACSSAITSRVTGPRARRSCSASCRWPASSRGATSAASEPLDDLIQVASLGLLKAIDRFEPDRPSAFSSFAVPTILGELKRHFRDRGWSVRVPRDLQEMAVRVERVAEELSRGLGRAPTPGEIAEHIGATTEQVLEAREAAGAYRAVSLDRPRDDDEEARAWATSMGIEDPGFGLAEDAATVQRLMVVLSDREREVLRLRFEEDLTQSEIGARVGVSQMHVSRLIRQAVTRLREEAAVAEDDAA